MPARRFVVVSWTYFETDEPIEVLWGKASRLVTTYYVLLCSSKKVLVRVARVPSRVAREQYMCTVCLSVFVSFSVDLPPSLLLRGVSKV